jgi:hypothetical protein
MILMSAIVRFCRGGTILNVRSAGRLSLGAISDFELVAVDILEINRVLDDAVNIVEWVSHGMAAEKRTSMRSHLHWEIWFNAKTLMR